jgi:hypothetical protein
MNLYWTVGQQQGTGSSLHRLTNLGMWTKLRPFAHRFLEEASKLYEMYVYTMGYWIPLVNFLGTVLFPKLIAPGDIRRISMWSSDQNQQS